MTRFEGVLKLIVPLTPRQCLDTAVPAPDIAAEIDLTSAPSLVMHVVLPRRDWAPFEEYRRPFDASVFVDDDAWPEAQAMYIWFREIYEVADNSAYRRQVVFEHIRSARMRLGA